MEPSDQDNTASVNSSVDQLKQIHASILKIEQELERVNAHKLVRVYNSIPQLIGFQFIKGMAFGLGSVIGATIIVSIVVYLLSQIEFVPVIGEWVKLISEEIKK